VANTLDAFRNGAVGWVDRLDLSLSKFTDLFGDKLSNLERQRAAASRELMEHFVRRKRSIRNKDWSLVGWVNLFSAVHLHVRKASVRHPRQSPLPIRLIVAKLKTINRVVGSIPNDQVEEVIAKPPSVVIAANRLFGRVIEHRTDGLTTIRRKSVSPISAFLREGRQIKRKHVFFFIGGPEQGKPKPARDRREESTRLMIVTGPTGVDAALREYSCVAVTDYSRALATPFESAALPCAERNSRT